MIPSDPIFRASTLVEATAEELFVFHSDPHNLPVVMPPTTRVRRLTTDGPAEQGRLITLEMREMGVVPMHFVSRWKVVQSPSLLVDEMLEGPFRLFVHEHHFDMQPSGKCLMTDVVTYAWGRAWWGNLVSRTFVAVYLHLMFAWRHWRTRAWFAQKRDRQ